MTITNGFLWNIIAEEYHLTLCKRLPDLLIYGPYGNRHRKYSCPKIFWTAESKDPDYSQCDFAFSFAETSAKNMHISNIVTYDYFSDLLDGIYTSTLAALREDAKDKFCNFIYKNDQARERVQFCRKLLDKKHVDCLGTVLKNTEIIEPKNHTESWKNEKLSLLKQYRFTIAFENRQKKGYVTEKMFHPLLVGSIPIYWGAPDIRDYFNPKAFIAVDDFDTYEECIDYVLQVNSDRKLLAEYRSAPPILPSSKFYEMSHEKIRQCFLSQVHGLVDVTKVHFTTKIKSALLRLIG
jgi:hypothetical protein